MDELKNRKKVIVMVLVILVMLSVGVTYAFFTYSRVSNKNNQLIAGEIYMHFVDGEDVISLERIFPENDEVARSKKDNVINFTIDGKNTTTNKDIWYEIKLIHGDEIEDKIRLNDKDLKFDLIETINGVSETVINGESYLDLTDKAIWVNTVDRNTLDEIEISYELRMWVSDTVIISDTDENADYTTDEYKNSYASIKVEVYGDFEEKEAESNNFVKVLKSKVGTDGLVAVNTEGELYDESDETQEIREYRYTGKEVNNYVVFNDDGDGEQEFNELWQIVGVFKDTVKDKDGNVILDDKGKLQYEEKVKLARVRPLWEDEMPIYNGMQTDIHYGVNNTLYALAHEYKSILYWNSKVARNDTFIDVAESNNDWTTAGLQYWLNTEKSEIEMTEWLQLSYGDRITEFGYLNNFSSKAKKLISPTTYYLGNVDPSNSIAKNLYAQERNVNNVWEGNKGIWNGLVGILYPSDYAYSVNSQYWDTDISELDYSIRPWFDGDVSWGWFISPSSLSIREAIQGVFGSWEVDYYESFGGYVDVPTLPVLHLVSSANVYLDGDGTKENPYVVVE